jgi:hypothetical protein
VEVTKNGLVTLELAHAFPHTARRGHPSSLVFNSFLSFLLSNSYIFFYIKINTEVIVEVTENGLVTLELANNSHMHFLMPPDAGIPPLLYY